MNDIKTILRQAGTGILIGALMSILVIILLGHPVTVTPAQAIAILAMSALIGLLSAIFDTESIKFYIALPIHFTLTAMIVFGTNQLLGGFMGSPLRLGLMYIVIYIGVWILLRVWWYLDAHRINVQLRKRNRNH